MTKRREKSDDRTVAQGRRKSAPTGLGRGARAVTVSQWAEQLELFAETAATPQGGHGAEEPDQSVSSAFEAPESATKTGEHQPATTMMMDIERIAAEENLREAFARVARNKGAAGPDRQSVETVAENLEDLIPKLRRALLDGSYRPGDIRRVWIPKAGGGQRGLGIPNVVDRLVQQAVHQVLSPYFEQIFHRSSHGFRPGRGCHSAIAEAREHIGAGYEWVVDLDLEKFFDRVHHQRLLSRLGQHLADRRVLELIRRMLQAKVVMPDGVLLNIEEGVPQGGPLSPLLSNVVLDELDQELERRGHRFVRYADDCNIYVRSERAGQRVMQSIRGFIEKRLRLRLNANKSAVARPETRHFLGFRLHRNEETDEVDVLLSERSIKRLRERVAELTPRNWGQSLRDCIQPLGEYLDGWMGYFHACTKPVLPLLKELDGKIRRRLRAIVLRHWRRKSTIAKRLIGLGARPWQVYRHVYDSRASWWELSACHPVNLALRNAYFEVRGHRSLHDLWHTWRSRPIVEALEAQVPLG